MKHIYQLIAYFFANKRCYRCRAVLPLFCFDDTKNSVLLKNPANNGKCFSCVYCFPKK